MNETKSRFLVVRPVAKAWNLALRLTYADNAHGKATFQILSRGSDVSIQVSNIIHRDISCSVSTRKRATTQDVLSVEACQDVTPRPRQGFRIVDTPYLVVVNSCGKPVSRITC